MRAVAPPLAPRRRRRHGRKSGDRRARAATPEAAGVTPAAALHARSTYRRRRSTSRRRRLLNVRATRTARFRTRIRTRTQHWARLRARSRRSKTVRDAVLAQHRRSPRRTRSSTTTVSRCYGTTAIMRRACRTTCTFISTFRAATRQLFHGNFVDGCFVRHLHADAPRSSIVDNNCRLACSQLTKTSPYSQVLAQSCTCA